MKEGHVVWKRNKLAIDSVSPELSYTVELRTRTIVLAKPGYRMPLTKREVLAVLEEIPEIMEIYFEDTEAKELCKKLEQMRKALLKSCGKERVKDEL